METKINLPKTTAQTLEAAGYEVWQPRNKTVVVISNPSVPVNDEFVMVSLGEWSARARREGGSIVIK